eukprot:COSAG01_NODE_10116_length_2247_cov_1.790037_2_plen_196_part_00
MLCRERTLTRSSLVSRRSQSVSSEAPLILCPRTAPQACSTRWWRTSCLSGSSRLRRARCAGTPATHLLLGRATHAPGRIRHPLRRRRRRRRRDRCARPGIAAEAAGRGLARGCEDVRQHRLADGRAHGPRAADGAWAASAPCSDSHPSKKRRCPLLLLPPILAYVGAFVTAHTLVAGGATFRPRRGGRCDGLGEL